MDVSESASKRWPTPFGEQSPTAMQDAARYILQLRKAAKSNFGPPVLSEPAWNLMLALYSADPAYDEFRIGSLAERANVPRSTTLRWLLKLQERGVVALESDPRDKRAVSVRMTEAGRQAMARSLSAASFIVPSGLSA